MDNLWLGGMGVTPFGGSFREVGPSHGQMVQAANAAQSQGAALKELEHQVERLSLMNQALWELLRDRLGLTDAELQAKALEVDLRDGVQDGMMTNQPVSCPACDRVSNSKHHRCLYCGQLFERPLFG
jgi:hypothetical protein